MQVSSVSSFLQKKSIEKLLVLSRFEIIPIKRGPEDPLQQKCLKKAKINHITHDIEFVTHWYQKFEQSNQQPPLVIDPLKSVENTQKGEQISLNFPQSEHPEGPIDTNCQLVKKEQVKYTSKEEVKKIDNLSSPKSEEPRQNVQLSPIKELEEQTEKEQKQNMTEKDSQKDKIQNSYNKNNSQPHQQTTSEKEIANETHARKDSNSLSCSRLSSNKVDQLTVAYNKQRIEYNQTKCRFFPNCEKKDCRYFHPQISCKYFPNCKSGISCMFVHKNCRFGSNCKSLNCIYTHPSMNFYQKQLRSKLMSALGQASLKKAMKKVLSIPSKQPEQRNKKSNP